MPITFYLRRCRVIPILLFYKRVWPNIETLGEWLIYICSFITPALRPGLLKCEHFRALAQIKINLSESLVLNYKVVIFTTSL